MIAQRAGIGIAVLHQPAAGRQVGEHCALDIGNGVQEFNRLRAIGERRRQRLVVPFQIEPLPPGSEERVEAPVVVLVRGLDLSLRKQMQRLLADRLPVVAQHIKPGDHTDLEDRPVRHRREQVHQHIVGRHDGGMVGHLPPETEPHLAAEMHGNRGGDESPDHKKLRREQTHQHGEKTEGSPLAPTDLAGLQGRTQDGRGMLRWEP